MTAMLTLLAGVLNSLFAVFHALFWRLFGCLRPILQPLKSGLQSPASRAFFAVALATTAIHAAAML